MELGKTSSAKIIFYIGRIINGDATRGIHRVASDLIIQVSYEEVWTPVFNSCSAPSARDDMGWN